MPPQPDRKGRLPVLKIIALGLAVAPALWLGGAALAGGLGPRPWVAATHLTGDWALRLLFLCLAVTPVRLLFRAPQVMPLRRLLGLAALAYALAHLGLYVAEMAFDLARVADEISRRIYLTIGFAVVVGLAALGATSTNAMIKRLGGRRWRALHRLVYPLAVLGTLHFFMQSKLDVGEPTLMAGALVWLLGVRVLPRVGPAALVGLALFAAAATAGLEAAWIHLKAGAPLALVLAAHLEPALFPRPAVWVLAGGLVAAVAVAAARWAGNLSCERHILAGAPAARR